jgi:periplasmic glucans biosynthesis protein
MSVECRVTRSASSPVTRLCWAVAAFCLLLLCSGSAKASPESGEVNLDYVIKLAEERARLPFHSPRANLPKVLQNLDYDQYRQIRFRRDQALWRVFNLPFRIEFFHPGYLYQEPEHIYEFTPTHWQAIRFAESFFDYGGLNIENEIPANTGYAGFRILYQLNQTNQWDELGAFLGASYFRLLGKDQVYGQSARGLALDCGETDRPEEFPIFTDWWLGKPEPGDTDLTFFGLLDSVSCTGAYRFIIHPGVITMADIEAVIFLREPKEILAANPARKLPIKTIGLAPLTSMFWFGQDSERKFDDYRTGVHDADGLLVHMNDGEVLWRPLDNPAVMRHQIFHAPDIRGFGLLQRERSFLDYQDLNNLDELEPSVWVQPHGDWGDGDLHLVELSAAFEGLDNIVAFWDPKDKPAPMQPYRFAYSLFWQMGEPDVKLAPNRVVSTRVGLVPGTPGTRQFVIDFKGPKLDAIPENSPPEAIVNCSTNAAMVDNQVLWNPYLKSWRVMLKMQPKPGNNPVDMRCTLRAGTNVLSETWTYQWSPP